jgi:hypothetical protein
MRIKIAESHNDRVFMQIGNVHGFVDVVVRLQKRNVESCRFKEICGKN